MVNLKRLDWNALLHGIIQTVLYLFKSMFNYIPASCYPHFTLDPKVLMMKSP